jgi:hypothetical protein
MAVLSVSGVFVWVLASVVHELVGARRSATLQVSYADSKRLHAAQMLHPRSLPAITSTYLWVVQGCN